jgi:hypothetical protein
MELRHMASSHRDQRLPLLGGEAGGATTERQLVTSMSMPLLERRRVDARHPLGAVTARPELAGLHLALELAEPRDPAVTRPPKIAASASPPPENGM